LYHLALSIYTKLLLVILQRFPQGFHQFIEQKALRIYGSEYLALLYQKQSKEEKAKQLLHDAPQIYEQILWMQPDRMISPQELAEIGSDQPVRPVPPQKKSLISVMRNIFKRIGK